MFLQESLIKMKPTEEIKKFANEALPVLRKYGYLDKESSDISLKSILTIISIFSLGLLFGGLFLYGIETDAFKSDINQDVQLEPEINITNNYDFTPTTSNVYTFTPNYTIINYINCSTS